MKKNLPACLKFCIVALFPIGLVYSQNNALVLNGAYMYMNGGSSSSPLYMVVNQPNAMGIVRNSGHIISENQYHYVRWMTGSSTGNYVLPFGVGGVATNYIPVTFNKTGGNSTVTISTYGTGVSNTPLPGASISNGSPVGVVTSMPQAPDAIDRFWDIHTSASTNANLTLSYLGSENTVSPAGCATDTFKMQNWNGSSWNALQLPGSPGVASGVGTVGPVNNWNTFGQFALTRHPIEITGVTTTQPCTGQNTGVITVNATGGRGAYTYTWTPNVSTTNTATGLAAGTYTITVTGANGCNTSTTVNLTALPNPTASITPVNPNLCAGSNITLTASGGTSYNWSSGLGTNASVNVSPAITTTYTVTVTGSNGCTATASTTVTVVSHSSAVNITASPSGTICAGSSVTLNVSGGGTGSTYSWSDVSLSGANPTFTLTSSGTYTVTVTDPAACSGTATATANVTVSDCSGITEEDEKEKDIILYPNPNDGAFEVVTAWPGNYELIDMWGRVVRSYKITISNASYLIRENLPSGMYYLVNREKWIVKKVIIK